MQKYDSILIEKFVAAVLNTYAYTLRDHLIRSLKNTYREISIESLHLFHNLWKHFSKAYFSPNIHVTVKEKNVNFQVMMSHLEKWKAYFLPFGFIQLHRWFPFCSFNNF